MLTWLNSVINEGGPRIKALAYGIGIVASVFWLTFSVCRRGITPEWNVAYIAFLTATVTAYVGSKIAEK